MRQPLSTQWGALNNRQRWTVAGIIAIFVGLPLLLGWDKRDQQMDILRTQFNLPPQIEFVEFERGSSKLRWPSLEGTVLFSATELRDYLTAMDDDDIWQPEFLRYRGVTTVDQYSRDALRWRNQRPPLRYGSDGLADWGIFSDETVRQITNGRYFCYAILQTSEGSDDALVTRALSCWQLGPRDDPVLVVEGVLDIDRRTLHMRI